ncbi:MAG: hypothetical protein N2379_10195 [Verrucomicrobiae bacterium]|nr:hypothetical protein [Verrucomicrobiae bacterium]
MPGTKARTFGLDRFKVAFCYKLEGASMSAEFKNLCRARIGLARGAELVLCRKR